MLKNQVYKLLYVQTVNVALLRQAIQTFFAKQCQ
jgi:hypothetical protein